MNIPRLVLVHLRSVFVFDRIVYLFGGDNWSTVVFKTGFLLAWAVRAAVAVVVVGYASREQETADDER